MQTFSVLFFPVGITKCGAVAFWRSVAQSLPCTLKIDGLLSINTPQKINKKCCIARLKYWKFQQENRGGVEVFMKLFKFHPFLSIQIKKWGTPLTKHCFLKTEYPCLESSRINNQHPWEWKNSCSRDLDYYKKQKEIILYQQKWI